MLRKHIGTQIKKLRMESDMTLKQLSDLTGLSVGFLSQLERGMTSVAIDTLFNIASVLGVSINYFFPDIKDQDEVPVVRRYEYQIVLSDKDNFIQYRLSKNLSDKDMFPRLIEILPRKTREKVKLYTHEGEEFIYIIEGILTYYYKSQKYDLYPGDCLHVHSEEMHNWENNTNGVVRLLEITVPNKFKKIQE
ncbi:MAG: helix-turn-helix domain-containing protein [Clostridiales bacterium]|nr:helix-turn-helix domain-containing protein [Clostridiales bacterium]